MPVAPVIARRVEKKRRGVGERGTTPLSERHRAPCVFRQVRSDRRPVGVLVGLLPDAIQGRNKLTFCSDAWGRTDFLEVRERSAGFIMER
jgi:hypothetical protein